MSGPPLEGDRRLPGVRKDAPYASLEEYLQTSYRLLRAECFSPVLKVGCFLQCGGLHLMIVQFVTLLWRDFIYVKISKCDVNKSASRLLLQSLTCLTYSCEHQI
jgi:hypothetical protein